MPKYYNIYIYIYIYIGTLRSTTRQAWYWRRVLQNKIILHAKQRESIILYSQHRPRSVSNATLSIFASSKRRELAESCFLTLISAQTVLTLQSFEQNWSRVLVVKKTSLKHQIRQSIYWTWHRRVCCVVDLSSIVAITRSKLASIRIYSTNLIHKWVFDTFKWVFDT